jgi:hypothetical protein
VEPLIRQRQREAQLVGELTRAGAAFGNVFGAIRKDLDKIDVSDELKKIADISKKRDESDVAIAQKRLEREQKAEADAAKALRDVERKNSDDRVKAFEETYKAIRDIERRFARDYINAVGNRDAAAAFQAQQIREDALEKQREDDQKHLQDIDRSLAREKQLIDERRREQLADAEADAQKQHDLEVMKAREQIRILNESIDQQLRSAFQFTNTFNTLFNAGYSQALNSTQAFLSNLSRAFGGGGAIPPGRLTPGTGAWQDITLPNGVQQPGFVVPYRPLGTGQGAVGNLLSNLFGGNQSRTLASNATSNAPPININFLGETTRTMRVIGRQEATQRVGRLLSDFGYPL